MARIKCKTPSTGRSVNITVPNVPSDWTTIADAPDFSVPDTGIVYTNRDPDDTSRGIRAGEIFFMTPIFVRNKSTTTRWIEVRLLLENGTIVECPGRMQVPATDTALIPLQGRSLLKRGALSLNGDRIQIRSELAGIMDAWASAEEKTSAEHIGVV